MNALNILPRTALIALAAVLIAVTVAVGYAIFNADSASSQGSVPGVPTNVRPEASDTENKYGNNEMRLVWNAPAAGNCTVSEYLVQVFKKSDGSIAEQAFTPNTLYVATKLQPSTRYTAEVWSYSAFCRTYSATPGMFTATGLSDLTNAANSSNDPSPPANQGKPASNPPGTVSMSKSGTSATLSWSAPTADSGRCSHSDYSWRVENRTTFNVSDNKEGSGFTGTSVTVTGLTAGHYYLMEVWSYSDNPCNNYSPASLLWWTQ